MLTEFKKFALRGNVLDLAVGVIIGAAFGRIVSSVVDDLIMPVLGVVVGRIDFSNLFISLDGRRFATLAAAQEAGAPTLNYGLLLNAAIQFLIIAFVLFLLVRWFNRLQESPEEEADPVTRACSYCHSVIPIQAVRCPHCTSHLDRPAAETGPTAS